MIKILMIAACLLSAQITAAQTCKDTIPASTPDNRFIVNGDEVTDTATGLIWHRCSLGQTGNDCSGGSANLYTWQEALQAASAPWRLPDIKELRSIVEEKCYEPAINLAIFPKTIFSYYWSASPSIHVFDAMSWSVYFSHGWSTSRPTSDSLYVRLVRDQLQSINPTITAAPDIVRYGGETTLTYALGGAASCTISAPAFTTITVTVDGSTTATIYADNTFTLDCGTDGSDSVIVELDPTIYE